MCRLQRPDIAQYCQINRQNVYLHATRMLYAIRTDALCGKHHIVFLFFFHLADS